MQDEDGHLVERHRGTPQGGVVSPLLANLLLHYAFDRWVTEHLPSVRFCRYANDGVVHCKSLPQAQLAAKNRRAISSVWIRASFGENADRLLQGYQPPRVRSYD